jgi:hypothetical protein
MPAKGVALSILSSSLSSAPDDAGAATISRERGASAQMAPAPPASAVPSVLTYRRRGWAMTVKRGIRLLFEKLTGTRIYRHVPHGADLFEDLRRSLPAFRVETVFDVGANVGQSATAYLRNFTGATIYCFEPVAATASPPGQSGLRVGPRHRGK